MAHRRLDPEEAALWAKVIASVRPIGRRQRATPVDAVPLPPAETVSIAAPSSPTRVPPPPAAATRRAAPVAPGETLDAGWDKRLARGLVAPDLSIDLHGHTLASAHLALDDGLAHAIATGARLLLLVTGRPPTERGGDGPRRGAIRGAVGDWLAGSRHAARIAAVRNAHPRHGGAGALYIVLRRRR